MALGISILEIGSFAFLHLDEAREGSKETFHVRAFTARTGDARAVTMKRDVVMPMPGAAGVWSVRSNFFGARVPPDFSLADLSSAKPKILFLGDSVPFGWGIDAAQSLPAELAARAPDYIVINGAIPSYSLGQSIARFRTEFADLKSLAVIYLQIYDPVSQYAIFGAKWDAGDNWTNFQERFAADCRPSFGIFDALNFTRLAARLFVRWHGCADMLASDPASDARLTAYVRSEVITLRAAAPRARLILAPVTPSTKADLAPNYRHALTLVNDALEKVAGEIGADFLDTRKIAVADQDFIDRCCHLSPAGAAKIAQALAQTISAQRTAVR